MKYRYIGKDMGIPGLPHEISDEQVKEDSAMQKLLADAIANGAYVEVTEKAAPRATKTVAENKE